MSSKLMSCGKRDWTPVELMAFEEEIAHLFLAKRIHCPIHLSRRNEEQLIKIFQRVKPEDWVLSTHRSHYHALLHGIHPDWLRAEILAGRSMHIMSSEHRFFSSSIVAGIAPIAVGLAMGIKMRGAQRRVFCFIGDMASYTGAFHEARTYAKNFGLPVTFAIEDNLYSTNTLTKLAWGVKDDDPPEGEIKILEEWERGGVLYYRYSRGFPHTGVQTWVQF